MLRKRCAGDTQPAMPTQATVRESPEHKRYCGQINNMEVDEPTNVNAGDDGAAERLGWVNMVLDGDNPNQVQKRLQWEAQQVLPLRPRRCLRCFWGDRGHINHILS